MNTSKLIYQCIECGNTLMLHKQKVIDDIYSYIYCPHCKKTTAHLEYRQDILDFYADYDPVMDERFYDYNNKTK